jgi:hypothetical protein
MTLLALKTAIKSTLTDDVTLAAMNTGGVHDKIAPGNTSSPYITYQIAEWADDYTIGKQMRTRYRVEISCWTEDLDSLTTTAMADRLHALLTDSAFTVSGSTTMQIRRTGGNDAVVEQFSSLVFQRVTSSYQIELT